MMLGWTLANNFSSSNNYNRDPKSKKKVRVIFVGDNTHAPVPQNLVREDATGYLEKWWEKKPMRKGIVFASFWPAFREALLILKDTEPANFLRFPQSVLSHYRINIAPSSPDVPDNRKEAKRSNEFADGTTDQPEYWVPTLKKPLLATTKGKKWMTVYQESLCLVVLKNERE